MTRSPRPKNHGLGRSDHDVILLLDVLGVLHLDQHTILRHIVNITVRN